jgi:nucleotide-binding universal stress UspA family protein
VSFPLERIVCPTDFSPAAAHALQFATALGRWFEAQVTVVHVHPLRLPVAYLPSARAEVPDVMFPTDEERDQLAFNLRLFVETEAPGQTNISWHVDESTDIAEAITARARAIDAQLIVLGTRGASALRRQFVGSITERVLRTAPCPILSVPPQTSRLPGPQAHVERVLCAIDFSAASLRALDCALALASRVNAPVTLAHIIELPADIPNEPHLDMTGYRRARFEHAAACLGATLAAHRPAGLQVQQMLLAGRPAVELLRLAQEQEAEVIVMGVQGHTALDSLFFGSVTHQVLRQAACPVLTVR